MIDIDRLEPTDRGRWVIYNSGRRAEEGRITSWNSTHVFVVFACDGAWERYQNFTAAATPPERLAFIGGRTTPQGTEG